MTSIYLTLNLQTGQASIDYTDSKSNNHTTTAPQSVGNAWTKQLTQDLTKSRELHELSQDGVEMRYDSTGMFHWCTPRRIAEAEITKEQCAQLNLQVRLLATALFDLGNPIKTDPKSKLTQSKLTQIETNPNRN